MLETDEEESLIEIKDAVFQETRIGTLNVVSVEYRISKRQSLAVLLSA